MRILLAALFLLFSTSSMKATHLLGGEITWNCIPSGHDAGKLVFKVKLYRLCSGIGLGWSATLNNPLYQDHGGPSTITCTMVSKLDMTPPCYDTSISVNCISRSNEAMEEFLYLSNPVQINGIPDSSGSNFSFATCCRPGSYNLRNISGSGYYLRSTMYPYYDPLLKRNRQLGSDTLGPTCYDTSPEFIARPASNVCLGQDVVYSHAMFDLNGDSIRYSWSSPMQSVTNPISWKSGYSSTMQLPNRLQDTSNVGPFLDTNTGIISFNSVRPGGMFSICVKADSYKKGKRIATVYRDIVINLRNCGNSSVAIPPYQNDNKPTILFRESGVGSFVPLVNKTYTVGQNIEFDIFIHDPDSIPVGPGVRQALKLEMYGPSMSLFPNDTVNCLSPPCAYLDSNSISWAGGIFLDTTNLFARFRWNTSCLNLQNPDALPASPKKRVFEFLVKGSDNWCPVPGVSNGLFRITLVDSSYSAMTLDTLDASQGGAHLSWTPFSGSAFGSYDVYRSEGPLKSWTQIASIPNISSTTYYDASAKTDSFPVFYQIRNNLGSGCEIGYEVSSIWLKALEVFNKNVFLFWNRPYWNNLRHPSGTYLIYRKDSSTAPWILIDTSFFGVERYLDSNVVFNSQMQYRIESLDSSGLHAISNVDSINVRLNTPPPPTGVEENSLSDLKIFPNPAHDDLFISLPENEGYIMIEILDVNGKSMLNEDLQGVRASLDISALNQGLYFVRIQNSDGFTVTKKFMVGY